MIQSIYPENIINIFEYSVQKKDSSRLKVLLMADDTHHNSNVTDDIKQYKSYSKHKIDVYNPIHKKLKTIRGKLFPKSSLQIEKYDAIIIHFSIYILGEYFLSKDLSERIKKYKGLKIQTIRDEYRNINDMIEKQSYLGINILFSVLRVEHIKKVYEHPSLSKMIKVSCIPGHVSDYLTKLNVPKIKNRKINISYRSRFLPAQLGKFAQEKIKLGIEIKKLCQASKLSCDISVLDKDRVYGSEWIDLHNKSKVMLAAPGGASLFDFSGEALKRVTLLKEESPYLSEEKIIDEELSDLDGNIIHKQTTPRIFEAIALRVPLLMPINDYRGIFKPWDHYIPLEDALTNWNEIVKLLRDDYYLQDLADRAFSDIVKSGRWASKLFIEKFDDIISLQYTRNQ
ncbi:hypothetical protein N8143_03535 [Pelagibacteraceae bacterium]|nr:hypothetical protein [Pelagibacteraceae bacterium]